MKRINVTKSFMPPIEEYEKYLDKIWDCGQLTNQGPLLAEFEEEAKNYLGLDNFNFVANGMLALQIALQALNITDGEVITTPFSYVATTSSILWQRCKPVFVDIEPDTFCIDPYKIEAAITDNTRAIMPVHVFGNPCNVDLIEQIAKKHNLKVIYDGAHAFGTTYKGRSLLDYGDISICSFHATKLLHTIEGGGLVIKDKLISKKIRLIKSCGHDGDNHLILGINAKASEFHAAMGLCNLKYVKYIIEERREISEIYNAFLDSKYSHQKISDKTVYNYSYYPIIFESEGQLLAKIAELNKENIFPRRYFYPSLNKLPYLETNQSCPISEDISSRILCLPLYVGLEEEIIHKICGILNR